MSCPYQLPPSLISAPISLFQTSASKFYKFKSKKRPWSMHTLPAATPTPANTPTIAPEKPLRQGQSHEEDEEEEVEDEAAKNSQKDEESEVMTFKYKSRVGVLSRSFRSPESAASRLAALHRTLENGHDNPSTNQITDHEEGVAENGSRQTSMSEESSTCNSIEGSRTELSVGAGGATEPSKREELVKSPSNKSHPYSKRIDISPRTLSPNSNQRSRPRILAYGKADAEGRKTKSPAMLTRRSTLSSIQTGRRLLPATPMRRGSTRPIQHANSISPSSEKTTPPPVNQSQTSSNGGSDAVSSFATKLVDSLETVASKEKLTRDEQNEEACEGEGPAEPRLHTTPCGSTSSINSKEEVNSRNKHTVQYNNSSALFSKGEWVCLMIIIMIVKWAHSN